MQPVTATLGGGGRRGDLSSTFEQPVRLMNAVFSKGGRMARDESADATEKWLMATLDMASYLSRIPVSQTYRRASRGYEQWKRGDGTPFSMLKPAAER